MLTSFTMLSSLRESAGTYAPDVPAMEITGLDMNEASDEMVLVITEAAADYMAFSVASDEVMVEAAISDPSRMDVLSENIFTTIINKARAFINKMIAAVKKIIDMIKAYFFKLMGKTDQWLNIMGRKIDKAMQRTGNSDLSAEMHEWDEAYVREGMVTQIGAIIDAWRKHTKDTTFDSLADMSKSTYKGYTKQGDNYDHDETMKGIGDVTDKVNDLLEKFYEAMGKSMGFSGVSTMDDIFTEVRKKANGGEKVTVKYSSKIGSMRTAIKDSSKLKDSLTKKYNDYLKELNTFKSSIDKSTDKVKFDDEKDNPSQAAAARASMKAKIDFFVNITTKCHNTADGIRKINMDCVNQMVTEYMTVLTKFVNAKEPKKD